MTASGSGLRTARNVVGVVFIIFLAFSFATALLRFRLGPLYWYGVGVPFVLYVLLGLLTLDRSKKPPSAS